MGVQIHQKPAQQKQANHQVPQKAHRKPTEKPQRPRLAGEPADSAAAQRALLCQKRQRQRFLLPEQPDAAADDQRDPVPGVQQEEAELRVRLFQRVVQEEKEDHLP